MLPWEEKKYKNDLKSLCIKKLVDKYRVLKNIATLEPLNLIIIAFQEVTPFLSANFYPKFNLDHLGDFEKFIWFVHYFVCDSDEVNLFTKDFNATALTNRIINSKSHGEVKFIGQEYLGENIIFAFLPVYERFNNMMDPRLKVADAPMIKKMFQNNKKVITKKKHHKFMSLTIFNRDFVPDVMYCLTFFDLHKGTLFNFGHMLKELGYPGIVIGKNRTYQALAECILHCFAQYLYCLNFEGSENYSLNIIRGVEKTNGSSKNVCALNRKTSKVFERSLKLYSHLTDAEVNMLDVSDEQKKSLIKCLNKNLIYLKLTFIQPISFLLYVGKKLKNLQRLNVYYVGNRGTIHLFGKFFSIKPSKYFSDLNNKNLSIFSKLKHFAFAIRNHTRLTQDFLLKTILIILKCCRKTLVTFEFECYGLDDIENLIDFICSNCMSLKFIRIKDLHFLTDDDVMKFAKFDNGNEMLVKVLGCEKVTQQGKEAALSYVIDKKLNKKLMFYERY